MRTSFFLLIPFLSIGQLRFSERDINLGTIEEAYEIAGSVVLTNGSEKKIYLLRADADRGVKVYTSRKILAQGDTCLLVISFAAEKAGRFKKIIHLVSSDSQKAYTLNVTGKILSVTHDEKTACYYFGGQKIKPVITSDQPLYVQEEKKRDASNRLPESVEGRIPQKVTATERKAKTVVTGNARTELDKGMFKPNNLLFLIDVSGSMKDTNKLPLMKAAFHQLIDAVRDIDSLTLVTYSDSIKVMGEAVSGSNKIKLHHIVDQMKARGLTRGRKAIQMSQHLAQKHFIDDGNNLLIIASDGKFRFEEADYKKWREQQGAKKIVLSTIAFGNERVAIRNLKEIARKGEGSFIHITSRQESAEKLLTEIKARSRKN
jgi:Mg-chelatase subunit ChlD